MKTAARNMKVQANALPLRMNRSLANGAGRNTLKRLKVVSLFAGCGGLDLGFLGGFNFLNKRYKRLPIDIVWANDINGPACQTYSDNFGKPIHCGDIWDLLNEEPLPKNVDIVVGGFPCQDFSLAGKRRGMQSERGKLYTAMVEVVRQTKPQAFVAENVKGLLVTPGAVETIEADFAKLGYIVNHNIYHAADYGVPQMRERVVFVGLRDKHFVPPKPTHEGKWITAKEALADLARIKEGNFANHIWSKAKRNNGQGNKNIKADMPGPTMRAEHHGNIEFHYSGKRRLSVREAARIQSFPDDFVWADKQTDAYRQIGNAVPPVLAWHIASQLVKTLKSSNG